MTNTTETLTNFTVYRDNAPDPDFTPEAPTAATIVLNKLHSAIEQVKLETALIAFDALHKTNYRTIRHDLIAAKRNADWEARIGIVRR